MFRKPHDLSRLLYYKNMAHEELWLECAQKLTTIIQQIIEFAKMVPGFMKLSQDDQIVLLKAGERVKHNQIRILESYCFILEILTF